MADLKLETFIKVILMTGSDSDGEALAAIRRANSMLRAANTNWDALLRGKVTVVADPFTSIEVPRNNASQRPAAPPPPPPPPPPRATPPRSPSHNYTASARTTNTNTYPGTCFYCNVSVPTAMGAIRQVPSVGTKVFCEDCNHDISRGNLSWSDVIHRHQTRVQASYAPRVKRKVTTADLMSDLNFTASKKGP